MPNTAQTKGIIIPPKSKTKSRINKRQRNRRRNKQKSLNNNQQKGQTRHAPQTNSIPVAFSESAHKKGAAIWGEAYANAVRWHGEHQNNFWRHAAEQLENENQMLRQQLAYVANNIKPETHKTQLNYETSDEECEQKDTITVKKEEAEDEVDSKYLEFLQVTIKHREELRLKREAADLLEEEDSTAGDVG